MGIKATKAQLEIACFTMSSALIAQKNGADRVEFCDGILVGGITPDHGATELLVSSFTIDLFVMIRPRGGNFVYTESEFNQMKSDIINFKKIGVNGFVFGILNEDYTINTNKNKELVDLAHPLPCTFHRAFDEVTQPIQALEDVIQCGFTTVLTSGQAPNVIDGVNQLARLVEAANKRVIIMPGGGLRAENIEFIQQKTQATFFHSSAIIDVGELPNPSEIVALKSKLQ
jgi:copper homeostasis protein